MANQMKSKIYENLHDEKETQDQMKQNKEQELEKPEKENKALYDQKKHNIWIGGLSPDDMTHTEYLKKLTEGPCNPTIMIPGLAGSKLRVYIDCEILKEKEPETFKSCGWSTCEKGSPERPKLEYPIWIPKLESTMSLF